jgi:hypothetical protein
MKSRLLAVGILATSILASCADRTAPAAQPAPTADEAIASAVRAALGGDLEARYFDRAFDLNGDGQLEVVAYAAGPMVCGTGGCPVYVFTPGEGGYRLVSSISVARTPVRVSAHSSNGWRDLIVTIGGGGIETASAVLKFDGTTYPTNPTAPPAEIASGVDGTEVLIAEFESFTDGKPLP